MNNITKQILALLEQRFDIEIIEPILDEKQRLKDLSKDEIIDHFLQAKV